MTRDGIARMAISQPGNQTGTLGAAFKAAAGNYLLRHGRDSEETHERMRRPYGATPRRGKDWR